MKNYDTVVIGAGPGGLAAAYPLAQTQKVLVVESDLWGGTCPNRGCDPKKMLYSAVETEQAVQRMGGHGVEGEVSINWPDLMAFKRAYTSTVPEGTRGGLQSAQIDTVHGVAHFVDSTTIEVGGERYSAKNFVIATGQIPRGLEIAGGDVVETSSDFLDWDEIPRSIVFIGGGYISFELANIAAAAGSSVTLIHHDERPLKAFPQELVAQLMELMRARGIQILLNTEVSGARRIENGGVLLETGEGTLNADAVINATGRRANIDGLSLTAAGVETDGHGVKVDGHLRTTCPNIYAIGDVVSRTQPKLTPVAGFEGRYVADEILGKHAEHAETIAYPQIPTIVFGTEKLAQIGVSVNSAQKDTDRYSVETLDTTTWYTYNRVQDPKASVILVKDKSADGEVVGVATLSSVADEVINQFAEKFAERDAGQEPSQPIYAYPTPASDMSYFA
jgi:glutathione reductase (NADPH)